eukprot:m.175583 g.175583  ORF g.175583 m.175583 type:complete len:513 (+) comp16785_c2_seq5:186-1724(+)
MAAAEGSALESLLGAIGGIPPPAGPPPELDEEAPAIKYAPQTKIVTIVASGGDASTNTPEFEVGQEFEVLEHHGNGWIEVTNGGYIWPSWVAASNDVAPAPIPTSPLSLANDQLETRPSMSNGALQSISETDHSNMSSSVATPARGSLSFTGSCGSRFNLMHKSLHDDNAEWREVRLTRLEGSFGLQIAGGQGPMGLFVKQCRAQGAAFRSKQIRKYDQLIAVNGQNLQDATHAEAIKAIGACGDTALFVFRRAARSKTRSHLKTSRSMEQIAAPAKVSTPDASKRSASKSTITQFLESTSIAAKLDRHSTTDPGLSDVSCDEDYEAYEDDSDDSHDSRFGFDIEEPEAPAALAEPAQSPQKTTTASSGWSSPSAIPTQAQTPPTRSRRESDQAVQRLEAHVDAGESRRIEGWLMKQTASKGNSTLHKRAWRKRYFILQDAMLKYFKKKPLDGATATGYLVLHQSSVIRTSGARGFSVQTRDALLNFMAEDEADAQRWLATLRRVTNQVNLA